MSKISNQLSILFSSEISLKNFSFSQLIITVKKIFDTEGVPGFVKALVVLIKVRLVGTILTCRFWVSSLVITLFFGKCLRF